MNCRVCGQPLSLITTFENMPAMAQHLSDTPEQHTVDLRLCQCDGCGLVQLDNDPVWYWEEEIRTDNERMDERINKLRENNDFVSCNRLEHLPHPNEYLKELEGYGVIEVPDFAMISACNLFAEIMLDHLMYFTEDTLRFTLQYNGLEVMNINKIWDGFILSVRVRRRVQFSTDGFDKQKGIAQHELGDYIARYKTVAVYGASHQAFAYIATLHPKIAFVVDDSPLKQGEYTPVGGLLIHRPEHLHNADAVIIMGGGYSDIIAEKLEFDGGVAIMRSWGVEVVK